MIFCIEKMSSDESFFEESQSESFSPDVATLTSSVDASEDPEIFTN
jgi:hypothetical protein